MRTLGGALLLAVTAFAVTALALSSCTVRPDAAPGAPCGLYDACASPFICVDGRCTTSCEFVGDCDPDYICIQKVCAPRCETFEDCDNTQCQPSPFQGAKYCGHSLAPICAQQADCPAGWRCISGGTCVETCTEDAQCSPNEACYAQGTYGECQRGPRPGSFDRQMDAGMPDVAPPNNIPIDRDCAGKASNYCADNFGQYEVCYRGTCVTAPRTILVVDVSEGEACEPGDGEVATGGSDIVAVHRGDENASWATVQDIVVRDGGERREPIVVKTSDVDACDAEVAVSTGCGGWVALTTRLPVEEGMSITVEESGDVCGDPTTDRYRVRLCTDNRAVILSRDTASCTITLGEGTGTRTFEVTF